MGEAGDVVRRCYQRFNAGDVEGWLETLSPRVEWHDVPEMPGARTYRGRDEAREFAEDLLDRSDRLLFSINELSERGDSVLVDVYVDITTDSGADFGWRAHSVFEIREGMIRYQHGYSVREDALADFEARPSD